jgi:hypothetical protein
MRSFDMNYGPLSCVSMRDLDYCNWTLHVIHLGDTLFLSKYSYTLSSRGRRSKRLGSRELVFSLVNVVPNLLLVKSFRQTYSAPAAAQPSPGLL